MQQENSSGLDDLPLAVLAGLRADQNHHEPAAAGVGAATVRPPAPTDGAPLHTGNCTSVVGVSHLTLDEQEGEDRDLPEEGRMEKLLIPDSQDEA